jgi:hypothetical protein
MIREKSTGRTWRYTDGNMALEACGFDVKHFDVQCMDEDIFGAPDGFPSLVEYLSDDEDNIFRPDLCRRGPAEGLPPRAAQSPQGS